jgi:hypothetical protein
LHPLLAIINRKRTTDFINTFLLQYEQGGRLPVWELSSNETDCMIGYHSVSVIADAAVKGIEFDYTKALQAMKHSAGLDDRGLKYYKQNGCISTLDDGESVSKTLEYSYDDWCIAQMAQLTGDQAASNSFLERSQYWKNAFDAETGFMRARKNGGWYSPFDPFEVNFNYTEANAWQYLFAVPHEIGALMAAMGGAEDFEKALDALFSAQSKTSGREQPDISGLIGQYAHGNEPSHHMAYLYNYCGAPGKTQQRLRQIMNEFYHDRPDGLIGNEDCGQMSAWYVLSAIGFYPVCPGKAEYTWGSPLFDRAKIHLENGKTFSVLAKNNSPEQAFVQRIGRNGQPAENYFFDHQSILHGDTWQLEMGREPRRNAPPALPLVAMPVVVNPVIEAAAQAFADTLHVKVLSHDQKISPVVSFSDPGARKISGNEWILKNSSAVTAVAVRDDGAKSKEVKAEFRKTDQRWKIAYQTNYHTLYNGGGDFALMDGLTGGRDFRNGLWQGWWDEDVILQIDLGEIKKVDSVGMNFLCDQKSWIFFPRSVELKYSGDGIIFQSVGEQFLPLDPAQPLEGAQVYTFFTSLPPGQRIRYLTLQVRDLGKIPYWHFSAGGMPWIFCDEIFIH